MATKNITVPDIGGATDIVVIEVLVKAGDAIQVDTPLIAVESDKATMEIPSTEAGVVKEMKVKVGDKVSLGSVILVLETTHAENLSSSKKEEKPAAPNSPTSKKEEEIAANSPPLKKEGEGGFLEERFLNEAEAIHAGPAVRRLAREFGVNLAEILGSGPKQRIVMEDIQQYVKTRLAEPGASGNSMSALPAAPVVDFAKFGSIETRPLSRIQKLSGKNLHRNWLLVPHVTQFGEADITGLDAFRLEQKEKHNIKLTPLVFIMKAVVAALKAFPQFNASLDAQGENLILRKYFHLGVAVDTPDGLVVPVARHVDQKSLTELASELSLLSEKARNKQLTANEMQGGCFTISSLGGIGGIAFTPIVNVPEVAILGVSKSSHKPIYEKGEFVPRLMLPLSLSYDHRVIDGADGARFMVYLTTMLSDIRNLLL